MKNSSVLWKITRGAVVRQFPKVTIVFTWKIIFKNQVTFFPFPGYYVVDQRNGDDWFTRGIEILAIRYLKEFVQILRYWTRRLLLLSKRSFRISNSRRRSVSRNRKFRKRTSFDIAFSSSVGMVALFRLFVWLYVKLMMREEILILDYTSRFCFVEFIFGEINTHKTISCKYLSKNICTDVEEWHHGYFCLGYFVSSTHFDLVTLTTQKEWRLSMSTFEYDRYSHSENCIGLSSNSGLFFSSTDNKYLFFLLRHSFSFGFWSLLLS